MTTEIQAVEVFRTNVETNSAAELLLNSLRERFPGSKANFDLEDCDRILRIENSPVDISAVVQLVSAAGFSCTPIE